MCNGYNQLLLEVTECLWLMQKCRFLHIKQNPQFWPDKPYLPKYLSSFTSTFFSQFWPVYVFQLDACFWQQGVLLEIDFLKVGVHVETLGAKVVRPADVRDDTFSVFAYSIVPHPHVPVPLLENNAHINIYSSSCYSSSVFLMIQWYTDLQSTQAKI